MNGLNFLENTTLNSKPCKNEIEISIFGKGYGECIIIGCGNGDYIVVDSFINPDTKNPIAIDYLYGIGVPFTSIKKIVLTHWHKDHIEGIANLLQRTTNETKLVINPILTKNDFMTMLTYEIQNEKESVKEINRILKIISQRKQKSIFLASNDKRIHSSKPQNELEVFCLSPQDEDVVQYLKHLRDNYKIDSDVPYDFIDDNSLSIVLLVKFNGDGALLGSDLEKKKDENIGWNAIVNNYTHDDIKSSFFKIPHHGSKNGHCDLVWDKLIKKNPISVMTVFNRGHKLPTSEDEKRILNLSGSMYIIGEQTQKEKNLEHKLRKTNPNIKISHISNKIGLVRCRKKIDNITPWKIEMFGAVEKVDNPSCVDSEVNI